MQIDAEPNPKSDALSLRRRDANRSDDSKLLSKFEIGGIG